MASQVIANTMSPQASLLGLPPEARLRIYHFIFTEAYIRIHFNARLQVDSTCSVPVEHGIPYHIEAHDFPAAITRTCGQLRAECAAVFHTITDLRLCAPSMDPLNDPASFLASRPVAFLRQIRLLSVDWNVIHYVPFDVFTNLKELKVTDVRCCDTMIQAGVAMDDETTVAVVKADIRDSDRYQHLSNLYRNRRGEVQSYRLVCECIIHPPFDYYMLVSQVR